MNHDAILAYYNGDEMCVVCGKGLRPGETLATLHERGSKLPICCPLCLEAYRKDPKLYLTRLAERIYWDELRKQGVCP